jgi:ATP-dependent DNA ligase
VRPKDFSALPPAKVRFIESMYALPVQNLPKGNECLYEVKFDGYRCLAGRDSTAVTLWVEARESVHKAIPADRPCLRTASAEYTR